MQHASSTCNEGNGTWLPLIEYSVRSGLSLSTIRRRIKSNSLHYRLEQGRYLIFFEEPVRHMSSRPPVVTQMPAPQPAPARWEEESTRPETLRQDSYRGNSRPAPPVKEAFFDGERNANREPSVDHAVKMVSEAFEHALREKDERILLLERSNESLEERLNELRLLVKVLEEKYEVRY